MAKLTPEQQASLDELLAARDAPDAEEDFDVEIYSGDKGARVPFSKAKNFLRDSFGIEWDTPSPESKPKGNQSGTKKSGDGKSDESEETGEETGALRHFRQPRPKAS
jgi:hypothetical protein